MSVKLDSAFVQRLLQGFGHAAREIIGARYAVTGILDDEGSRLQSLYTDGIDANAAAQLGSPDPRSGVLRTVLREGRCVRVRIRVAIRLHSVSLPRAQTLLRFAIQLRLKLQRTGRPNKRAIRGLLGSITTSAASKRPGGVLSSLESLPVLPWLYF